MISAIKTRRDLRSQAGFTLLEVMVVLGLIALLLTFVFVVYRPDSNADRMRKTSIKVEALAARGHTMAMLHQRPFWLRFERNRVILQGPQLEVVDTSAGGQGEEFNQSFDDESFLEDEAPPLVVDYDTYDLPDGLELFVRRWGAAADQWFRQVKAEDPVIFWNFSENGLCEPVSLRLVITESWMELEMDPLTALISDESSEIYE